MFLLVISFVGGVLTVLAPCILPLLPVIVGGSLADGVINKKKAFTIIISLGISVVTFTLLLKVSTLFINIPPFTWTLISGGIILFLGIVTVFPSLWENKFLAKMSAKSNILLGKGDQKKSLTGDIIVGAALGPIFTTCSPIYFIVLATVLPENTLVGMLYLLSYVIGLCLALSLITFVGQKIMHKLNVASDPKGTFKRVLGIIFIIVGLSILTGYDKKLETAITNAGFFDVTKIEQRLLENRNTIDIVTSTIDKEDATSTMITNTSTSTKPQTMKPMSVFMSIEQKQKKYSRVPELSSIDGYINTDGKPITLESLRGKVVLLDIWTYSCINCQRTIPYINEWYAKYKDQGLEVVGLHTPEFSFEKILANVQKAVIGFAIQYPVVLDNDYSTWRELGNQFWPRKYLIDIDGFIVYDHIGEGGYADTEKAIQRGLEERATRIGATTTTMIQPISAPLKVVTVEDEKVRSPETYFGSARNDLLANGRIGTSGVQTLVLPRLISDNYLYLSGDWNFVLEYAENQKAGEILFEYNAKNVYMAAGSKDGVEVEIYRDSVLVKKIIIKDEKLYPLIEGTDYGKHELRIKIPKSGLQAFTFTFG